MDVALLTIGTALTEKGSEDVRYSDLEHPEIGWVERTGYPSWLQEDEDKCEFDEDEAYEERRNKDEKEI